MSSRKIKACLSARPGFTLIELLIVIAIIGILASIVLVSLSSAKDKARDSRLKSQVKQFSTLFHQQYTDTGTYAPLQVGWNTCTFSGTYATQAQTLCTDILALSGSSGNRFYTGNDVSLTNNFSVMVLMRNGTDYFCVGSSGRTSEGPVNQGGTWEGDGCYSDP